MEARERERLMVRREESRDDWMDEYILKEDEGGEVEKWRGGRGRRGRRGERGWIDEPIVDCLGSMTCK